MNKSLLSLFTKEWPWTNNHFCHSFRKSDHEPIALVTLYKRVAMNELLLSLFTKEWWERLALVTHDCDKWFALSLSKNEWFTQKNSSISPCFWLLFPFLCPRTNHSRCSSLCRSFLKSNGSNLLSSFFTKERQEQNRESLFCSFALKKRAIRSKNQRVNSQPCKNWTEGLTKLFCLHHGHNQFCPFWGHKKGIKPIWIPNILFGDCSLV